MVQEIPNNGLVCADNKVNASMLIHNKLDYMYFFLFSALKYSVFFRHPTTVDVKREITYI